MRREYRARRDALVRGLAAHLPLIRVHGISAGLHLYAELPAGWDEETVVAAARSAGLAAETVGPMRGVQAGRPPALVIGFARLAPHRISRAVHELAETLRTL
jgi:GntR family transcriptional regulator/MocR family aminotransferase